MAQQTVVEWLAKELENYGDPQVCEITWKDLGVLVQQAKQMEKEKLINFHIEVMKKGIISEGQRKWTEYLQSIIKEEAEQYYNETYNK